MPLPLVIIDDKLLGLVFGSLNWTFWHIDIGCQAAWYTYMLCCYWINGFKRL